MQHLFYNLFHRRIVSPNETNMKHLETLLEEYKGELAELEKAYHAITDMMRNHCDTSQIEAALQTQIIILWGKQIDAQSELDAHNAQFAGEREFDKYDKDNY